MITFGLITEGITDQVVLKYLLLGYFNDKLEDRIKINPLQPKQDEFGNWFNALEFCKTDEFREAFEDLDYIIIQIDTDICEEIGIRVIGENEKEELPNFMETVRQKIITDYIEPEFYKTYQHQIIFGLAIHSIECWLLPLFYKNNKKAKIANCLNTLNREVAKKTPKLSINPSNKDPRKYAKLSKAFLKQKTITSLYTENYSLTIFINQLEEHFQELKK